MKILGGKAAEKKFEGLYPKAEKTLVGFLDPKKTGCKELGRRLGKLLKPWS